jgi:hypothetical protein
VTSSRGFDFLGRRELGFSGKDHGHLKIVRWLRMLKIDALRLQHFEKDALVLVITAIRGVAAETPAAAQSESISGIGWRNLPRRVGAQMHPPI